MVTQQDMHSSELVTWHLWLVQLRANPAAFPEQALPEALQLEKAMGDMAALSPCSGLAWFEVCSQGCGGGAVLSPPERSPGTADCAGCKNDFG